MTKVLFLAYHFPPVGGAGVQRSLKFVQHLPAEGFRPAVITGPTSPDHRWTPHDRTLMESVPSNVSVFRVAGKVPDQGASMRDRMERWLALPGAFSKWWIPAATELAVQQFDGEKLIFATMSPFESGEVARQLSERLHIPWVADLRDPWALDEMQVYPSLLHRRVDMSRMERLLATAAIIIMNTPESAKVLKKVFPRLRNKPVLSITNGFDQDDFSAPMRLESVDKFRIVHSGYLHTDNGVQLRNRKRFQMLGGVDRGVDILTRSHTILMEALERWAAHSPEIRETVEVIFAGKCSAEDRAVADCSSVADLVRFPGYLSHRDSVNLVRRADLLFLPMHNLPPGERSRIVPGKTYEYMAAGRPILAAVPDGDARDFLEQCGNGLVCRPDDAAAMVGILRQVYSEWKGQRSSRSCNEVFVNQFERRRLTQRLATAFRTLVEPGASANGVTEAQLLTTAH